VIKLSVENLINLIILYFPILIPSLVSGISATLKTR